MPGVRCFTLHVGGKLVTKRILGSLCLVLVSAALCNHLAAAQSSSEKPAREGQAASCSGPVYKAKEVSRKAKITSYPPPAGMPAEGEGGRVVLKVVLCHTGEVTDIEIVEKLHDGLTEKAVEAAKLVKFIPAEKDGQKVSQRARFEYIFSAP